MRDQASYQPEIVTGLPIGISVKFDIRVYEYILQELYRHSRVEEGGKYIGYIDGPAHSRECHITITDFLPGGPRATRTAVEFMPDGEFQETVFRNAEQRDPAVEHIGTWHSHHCNGLRHLSGGDIRGYLRTVNKPAYRPQVFVASLVKEIPRHRGDDNWIDHFLFVKGETDRFYTITHEIEMVESPSIFADLTGHVRKTESAPVGRFWYETEVGRTTLAEDQRLFRSVLGLLTKATRKGGKISIRGEVGPKFICVSYPERPNDELTTIEVGLSQPLLSIQCSLRERGLGFAAARHALDKLDG